MTDLVTMGETMLKLSPPHGERLRTTREFSVQAAGAESNVAVAAAQLGLDSVWLSKLPDTVMGQRVTSELRSHGVEPRVALGGDTDRVATYYVEHGGAPRGTKVIYDRTNSAVTTATPDELAFDAIREAEWFHVTGITPALSGTLRETTAAALDAANEADTVTSFDLNYRSKLWSPAEAKETYERLLPEVDVLVAAIRDVRNVLDREGEAAELARGLAEEFDLRTVIVTRGGDGATAVHDGETFEQGIYEAETVDPVGTGDAFVGGYVARRLDGGSTSDALSYAAATAALKRTVDGDLAVVTPEEVEAVVREEDTEIAR